MLKNNMGKWIEEEKEIANLFLEFYRGLFSEDGCERGWIPTRQSWGLVDEENWKKIGGEVSDIEVYSAFFQMGGYKAPRIDGFPAVFYNQNWELVGSLVTNFIKTLWRQPERIGEVNETLVVLNPKVDKPEQVSQFRPIALCNVIYKGLAKILVNRLKPFLDRLISPYQTSFIPRRNIHDNIIVAKKVVHTMNRLQGNKGFMVIKIDLEKAYDRMSWSYIEKVLEEIELDEHVRKVIKGCVNSVKLSLMWNRKKGEELSSSRGLRQGDPLSPYLFVL
ncbi:hypothetical protein QN277_007846 [Acacia crassicarpa]|uniref:Reverse transcriptase domain-containing protein n=1 Tax=Acacia crassicarpa TaxID=499986 RepID=A0AAE1IWR8_9FABA|nr:hypothetical protein QN277_007846 [Acacia crassicarpa]